MERKNKKDDQNPMVTIQILIPKNTVETIKKKSKFNRVSMSAYLRNIILDLETTLN